MGVSSASAVIAQTSNATYQAWVQEIYTNLVTTLGLVPTQDSGQSAVPFAGTAPASTGVANATGHYLFTFTDSPAQGGITTTALVGGGTGGTNGTYTALTVTGATSGATSARASVTVSGGVAGNMTITTAGSGYYAGEKLTVSNANIPAAASWMPTVMSSGSPIVFRLDFGAGGATTTPQFWITLGAGSNGSGTINGSAATSAMTQLACCGNAALASTITTYTSRYCVNMTLGFVGVAFKQGAQLAANTNVCFGGFTIFRPSDNSGNPLGTAAVMITNSNTTTGTTFCGIMQCLTYSAGVGSAVYPTLSLANSALFGSTGISSGTDFPGVPFGLTTTLENGTVFAFPIYTMDPVIRFNAFLAYALQTDIAVGNTVSMAIVGSTALTFLAVGYPWGGGPAAFGWTGANSGSGAITVLMLWQ